MKMNVSAAFEEGTWIAQPRFVKLHEGFFFFHAAEINEPKAFLSTSPNISELENFAVLGEI